MPVVVNIAANVIFGAGLVLAVQRSPALHESFVSWSLFVLLGFEAAVFTPAATFLFRFYPQWSMLYTFDPQIFPALDNWIGWLSILAVLLNFGAALLGYTVARRGVLAGETWLWAAPIGAASAIILYVVVAFGERLVFIGDYDAFWQGSARLLVANAAGWLGILLYVSTGLLVAWLHRRFHDHDPKLI